MAGLMESIFGGGVKQLTEKRRLQQEKDIQAQLALYAKKQTPILDQIGGAFGQSFGEEAARNIFGDREMEDAILNTQRQKELNNLIANMDLSDEKSVKKVRDIYASIGDTNMVLRLDNTVAQRKRQNTQDNFYLNMPDKDFEDILNRANAERDFSKLQLLQPYVAEREEKRKELENQKRVQNNLSPNPEEPFISANINNPINVLSESEYRKFMNQSESK